jgi:hypothetical protein
MTPTAAKQLQDCACFDKELANDQRRSMQVHRCGLGHNTRSYRTKDGKMQMVPCRLTFINGGSKSAPPPPRLGEWPLKALCCKCSGQRLTSRHLPPQHPSHSFSSAIRSFSQSHQSSFAERCSCEKNRQLELVWASMRAVGCFFL